MQRGTESVQNHEAPHQQETSGFADQAREQKRRESEGLSTNVIESDAKAQNSHLSFVGLAQKSISPPFQIFNRPASSSETSMLSKEFETRYDEKEFRINIADSDFHRSSSVVDVATKGQYNGISNQKSISVSYSAVLAGGPIAESEKPHGDPLSKAGRESFDSHLDSIVVKRNLTTAAHETEDFSRNGFRRESCPANYFQERTLLFDLQCRANTATEGAFDIKQEISSTSPLSKTWTPVNNSRTSSDRDLSGGILRKTYPPTSRRGRGSFSDRKPRAINRPKHNHSKIATDLLKEWFYENIHDPFPSEEVKAELAEQTGLSFVQVSNWFVNIRKRVWKPLHREESSQDDTSLGQSYSCGVQVARVGGPFDPPSRKDSLSEHWAASMNLSHPHEFGPSSTVRHIDFGPSPAVQLVGGPRAQLCPSGTGLVAWPRAFDTASRVCGREPPPPPPLAELAPQRFAGDVAAVSRGEWQMYRS